MTIEHRFEHLEIKVDGKYYSVFGDLYFTPEDNSFSYDYGDQTNLTHDPGMSFDIENVDIDSVVDEDNEELELTHQVVLDWEEEIKNWFNENGYDSLKITLEAEAESSKLEADLANQESRDDH